MDDPIIFHETGAKWFRLARVALGVGAGFAVLTVAFIFYQPRQSGFAGSDVQALAAIVAVAGYFALCLGTFGWWRQRRKPKRLAFGRDAVKLDGNGPRLPWDVVDRLAFHWAGQRFELPPPLRHRYPMRVRLYLLIYVDGAVAERAAGRSLTARFHSYWYRTPFVVDLALLDAQTDDILAAIRTRAPADVLARSGMLEA